MSEETVLTRIQADMTTAMAPTSAAVTMFLMFMVAPWSERLNSVGWHTTRRTGCTQLNTRAHA